MSEEHPLLACVAVTVIEVPQFIEQLSVTDPAPEPVGDQLIVPLDPFGLTVNNELS